MSTPREQKIQDILEARKPTAEEVGHLIQDVEHVKVSIDDFKRFIPNYCTQVEPEVAAKLRALEPEVDRLLGMTSDRIGGLVKLKSRCERQSLNIGVVGRARQGKSQLLQSLTGLTPDEIPSGDGGHCTGAPSMVFNRDGETSARLTFHSESSFIENVIRPFFLFLSLKPVPESIAEFESSAIPDPSSPEAKKMNSTEQEYLKKLSSFKKNIDGFRSLLGSPPKSISKNEIREYIAQHDKTGGPLTKWIAVQLAEIYCKFPHADVGNIAVADTPGLGDFQSGAEQRLASAVGASLDSALFLKLPPNVGAIVAPEDTRLHDLIQDAIPELSIRDWSYFVINTYPAKAPDVDFFEKQLIESSINTRFTSRLDVGNKEEVGGFLDSLLTDIANNLGRLDAALLKHQLASIQQLAGQIDNFAKTASAALPKSLPVAGEQPLFTELFDNLWKSLPGKLEELCDKYRENREDALPEFKEALDQVFKDLDDGPKFPDEQTIRNEMAAPGPAIWFADKSHDLRIQLSTKFESLDESLKSAFDELRSDLLQVLVEDGKLGKVPGPNEFSWTNLVEIWEDLPKKSEIQRAVNRLCCAQISFRGLLLPRVRKALDVLDTKNKAHTMFAFEAGDGPSEMTSKLRAAWENAVGASQSEFNKVSSEPSMALSAEVEDFVDAIIRSGGPQIMRGAWFNFYWSIRGEIWTDQFEKLAEDTQIRKIWDQRISQLKDVSERIRRTQTI